MNANQDYDPIGRTFSSQELAIFHIGEFDAVLGRTALCRCQAEGWRWIPGHAASISNQAGPNF